MIVAAGCDCPVIGIGRMRYRAARTRCSWKVVFDAQWGYKDAGSRQAIVCEVEVEVDVEDGKRRSACSPVQSSPV